MPTTVVMPRLSLTMKEGNVGKWYKKEGEAVEKGEAIAEIVSEKATYDLEASSSGIIRKILVEEGVDAPVNAVLAIIGTRDEAIAEVEAQAAATQTAETLGEQRVVASPAAKRLAREHQIDLSKVHGSGPEGRIVEDDVTRLIEPKGGAQPKVKEVVPLSGFRKTTAERLSMSFRTAPHSAVVMEVDVSKAMVLHERLEVSYSTLIVKAAATALTEMPIVNSTLDGDRIKIFADVNVGVAVATANGLVVPVIRNADQKMLKDIDVEVVELTEKAQLAKLSREEVTGGTFTVTNLGMYGVDFFIPIINPPEAAILAVGRIAEKPTSVNGRVEIKPVMMLSLSYDHRVIDGAPAAEFLRKIKDKLEKSSSF
ncbi:MAG: dihydrolipoamide acetyltransferase family protein [Candidatus Bathyarchaeia archaeon]|jgi:pyruvate dehydrogenase E2 component (dihydrolipoamide acetyltransferase)